MSGDPRTSASVAGKTMGLSEAGAMHVAVQWLNRRGLRGRGVVIGVPYLWLLLFFMVPFFFVLKIALSEAAYSVPPIADMLTNQGEGRISIALNFGNFDYLFSDPLYVTAYLNSLRVAFIATVLTLLIGYPMAYAIARADKAMRPVLLMLVILPFWTSFLIRVYAWMSILQDSGLINSALMGIGIIDTPIRMLNTDFAVFIGIVYSYLPFMILPLYSTLEKMDLTLLEAAADLGCRPFSAFLRITLPLSVPGIVAGSLLVFIPAVGEFVVPELLGGPDSLMIGRVLWQEFFANRDWPVASSVAIALLLLLVIPIMIFQTVQSDESKGHP
jgi:putrescine transport system permease protein